MVVKFLNSRHIAISFVLMAMIFRKISGIEECKVNLLKYFGLTPLKYPVNNSMVICGNITENCCSMSDEIRIYRLWKRFSMLQITKHIDQLMRNYMTLFAYHDELLNIDFDKIEVKRSEYRNIPFKLKVCERIAYQLDEEEKMLNTVDLLNNNELLDDPEYKKNLMLKKHGRKLKDGSKIKDKQSFEKIDGNKQIKGRILESVVKEKTEGAESKPDRLLRVVLKDGEDYEEDATPGDGINETDKQLQDSLELQDKFKLPTTLENEQNSNNTQETVADTNIGDAASAVDSDNAQRVLKQDQANNQNSQNAPAPTANNIPKPARKTKVKRNRRRRKARPKTPIRRPFEFEEELPERKVQCTYLDRSVNKYITIKNRHKEEFCLDIRDKLKKFKIKDFRAHIPDIKVEMVRLMNLKKSFYCYLCDIQKQKRIDEANSLVTFDAHFCRRLVIDFRDYIKFQNVLLIEYIDLVLQYVRCFQTSVDEARFPYSSFLLMYQKNFEVIQKCYNNIDQPDFMKHCVFLCQQYSYTTFSRFFDGNPDLINKILMTLSSFFRKLRSNQVLTVDYNTIKNEFDLIDAVDFKMDFEDLKAKEDMAQQGMGTRRELSKSSQNSFKLSDKHSKYTKDDILSKDIHDNESKEKVKQKRGLEDEDGDDDEYDVTKSRIENMTKAEHHNYLIEKTYDQASPILWEKEADEGNTSIYETKAADPLSKVYRSRFVDDFTALNPFDVEPQINFDIKIKTLFKLQCDKQRKKGEKPEKLQREVITEYFSTNDEDIHNFATDLFMPFADYDFFHQKDNENDEKNENKVIL